MSEWIRTVVVYLLFVNLSMQMIPHKKYEQYVRLFTGLLLIIIVLQPVLKIRSADQFLETKIERFVQEQEELEKMVGKEKEIFQKECEDLQETKPEMVEIIPVNPVEVSVDD